MQENSFKGLRTLVGNNGVRAVIDELMNIRLQLFLKAELNQLGGWDDPLNAWLARYLGSARKTLSLVCYDPRTAADQDTRQADAEKQVKDENLKLANLFNTINPITVDDIQMPARLPRELPYDFSGASKDYPQLDPFKHKNTFLRQFSLELDHTCVVLSNLACQGSGDYIPLDDAAVIEAKLMTLYTILQTKGGTINRLPVPDGSTAGQMAADDVVKGEISRPGAV